MKLVWTERACDDLESIEAYVGHDSPVAAVELVDRLIDKAEGLREHRGSHSRYEVINLIDIPAVGCYNIHEDAALILKGAMHGKGE